MADAASSDWIGKCAGFLLGLATLYVGQILTKRNNRKVLSWDYAVSALASVSGQYKDEVEIYFKGEKIEDARSVSVTVKNTGPMHISASDFTEDMKLSLPGSKAIIQMRISNGSGKMLAPTVIRNPDTEPNTIYIKPLLMNPGEQFVFFALVTGFKDEPTLNARIAGGELIPRTSVQPRFEVVGFLGLTIVIFFALLLSRLIFQHHQGQAVTSPGFFTLFGAFIVSALIGLVILRIHVDIVSRR